MSPLLYSVEPVLTSRISWTKPKKSLYAPRHPLPSHQRTPRAQQQRQGEYRATIQRKSSAAQSGSLNSCNRLSSFIVISIAAPRASVTVHACTHTSTRTMFIICIYGTSLVQPQVASRYGSSESAISSVSFPCIPYTLESPLKPKMDGGVQGESRRIWRGVAWEGREGRAWRGTPETVGEYMSDRRWMGVRIGG